MERVTRRRTLGLIVVFLLVMVFYGFKLYDMQVLDPDSYAKNQSTFTTYTRVKAARGDILDMNGNVLVGNRTSFNLELNHYVLLSANGTNNHIYRLVKQCQELGIEYSESFPITRERPFTYTLNQQSSTKQGYYQSYLKYIGGLDSDITAPVLIQRLRDIYGFPEEWTDEEARAVIGIRYEMALRNCVGTLPNYVFLYDADEDALGAIVELGVPGLNVEESTVREYATGYAAHILGYVGKINPEQWEHYKNVEGYSMDADIGQSGLEAAYESYLHGVDGLREDTVATDGTLISQSWIRKPKAGANVKITIDLSLQRAAEDEMARLAAELTAQESGDGKDAEGMAVVAMDVKTGQVLVCGSYPTYDPEVFHATYNDLIADPLRPTYNRALLQIYPPGSTFKVAVSVAAIDNGFVGADEEVEDKGIFTKINGLSVSCLNYTKYGRLHTHVDSSEAIRVSCNYYYYEMGYRMNDNFAAVDRTAKALGLGEKTGIELFEYTGYRAGPETKSKLYSGDNKYWSRSDQVLAAIGQSDNRFTPIQLCSYAVALANQGTRYKATLLNRIESADYRTKLLESSVAVLSRLEISDTAYDDYLQGMIDCSHTLGGTAYNVFRNYPIQVASKTGTAQHGIYGRTDNGAFICFAPAENPRIAIAVYGEYTGSGGKLANVAKAIMDVYFSAELENDVPTYENKVS